MIAFPYKNSNSLASIDKQDCPRNAGRVPTAFVVMFLSCAPIHSCALRTDLRGTLRIGKTAGGGPKPGDPAAANRQRAGADKRA
jgi:hypothetical protein